MKNRSKKCTVCPKRDYCMNETAIPSVNQEDCFWAPSCDECLVNTHCKNRGLPDVQFGLTEGRFTPNCFTSFHSTK